MSQLTYGKALSDVLETTEMGYTLKSKDKLWTCFVFDDPATINHLYFQAGNVLSYDMWDRELMWTTRDEAEEFRDRQVDMPERKIYVINWGDYSRWEDSILTGGGPIDTGKFAGSEEALIELSRRWKRAGR